MNNNSIMVSCVIYGWLEDNGKKMIDIEWIRNNNIDFYSCNIYHNTPDGLGYGLPCYIHYDSGKIILDPEYKKRVDDAFKKTEKYYEENAVGLNPKLGYYTAISATGNNIIYKYENYIPEIPDK